MRKIFLFSCCLILLTACWNNTEIDSEAFVHGVGIDKLNETENLKVSVEIIRPGSPSRVSQSNDEQASGQHIILETEAESLLHAARKFIRTAKRRLYFGHSRVWIIGEQLAKDNFIQHIDPIRRDQMLRTSSYLFITKGDPKNVLSTATLYENLTSTELVSALEQVQFSLAINPIKMYEFYRSIEGPLENAYVPIIHVKEDLGELITQLYGTAVIKKNRMVGELNEHETIGLSWLIDNVKGGALAISLNEKDKVAYEIKKGKVKISPKLVGEKLFVRVLVDVEGTFADNVTSFQPKKEWFDEIEGKINRHIKRNIRETLTKLQTELKTDITLIGYKTYHTYPKQWQKLHEKWDEEIFANAEVSIHVRSKLNHKGLINKSKMDGNMKRPRNHPFQLFKK